MKITYRRIILRDMEARDIEDWIRWYNEETAWSDWDAPDEPIEPVDPDAYRTEMLEQLTIPLPEFRNFFELDTADGHHIGMVTAYAIGEDFTSLAWQQVSESTGFYWTVGIDICDSRFWGSGYGTMALACFCKHFLDNGKNRICLQTWSGNERMIRCAQRMGFEECNRVVGNRNIRGGTYDSLTFLLNLDKFYEYLRQNA